MKLNNKGFAMSAIIYSALILFLMVMLAFLSALSSRKNQLTKVIESAENTLQYKEININQTLSSNDYYITKYRGKYKITTPSGTGEIYLPKDIVIMKSDNGIKFENSSNYVINFETYDNTGKYMFTNISKDNKSEEVKIVSVYTNKNEIE